MNKTQIQLKKGKEKILASRHPWIFSGALQLKAPLPEEGSWVDVLTHRGEYLVSGHFHHSSIAVRILSDECPESLEEFYELKLKKAYEFRLTLPFLKANEKHSTNAYRMIYGEGDGLSGLIIDIYDHVAVIQCQTPGMQNDLEDIVSTIKKLGFSTFYVKPKNQTKKSPNDENQILIQENGMTFLVNYELGQKTGFFLDQRDNRQLLEMYAKDRQVLNMFAYSGGFSLFAIRGGAKSVVSIDQSELALKWAEHNVKFNFPDFQNHTTNCSDGIKYLENMDRHYDLIVLDPPAFAKSIKKRHNAVQAYKRINKFALKNIAPDGVLFTFSCSQVVDDQLFYHTIVSAALETGRDISVLHRLHQAPDHPVSLFHPEGTYLTGLVLQVR